MSDTTRPIRVLIADDQALLRAGFRLLIDVTPDLVAVGEAGTGTEAVAVARREQPDVVLMDIRMPRLDGLEATRLLAGKVRVLVLTTFDLNEYVYEALRAGAAGFLLKDATAADLAAAVRVVATGEALLAPSITRRLIERFGRDGARDGGVAASSLDALTEREREVLRLVARGLSNAEIADALAIGEPTVKTHVSHVLAKLGLRNRVQAVAFAYERGVVRAEHEQR
jgi:DNA-binding NarL/FixJ family response regulator